eukprot:2856882-Amphidinium_carterae.1
MTKAFETFVKECRKTELTRTEFRRFIDRHFSSLHFSRGDEDKIFDFLDANENGFVSIKEFHGAVEATLPVTSLQALRKKWLALGLHTSCVAYRCGVSSAIVTQ